MYWRMIGLAQKVDRSNRGSADRKYKVCEKDGMKQ
jgi:hypothetical protein